LAIAKALVERMGGRIWVGEQPAPGAKFVFTVFLPPSTADAVRHKAAGTTAARAAQQLDAGTSVLIVEDNPENVILLRAYLDSLPLALDYATNGVEALKKRQQGSYDIVLMDIQMPIMDGLTATRVIRTWEKEHAAPRVPIVALTAHALNGCAADSLAAGCDGHLTKPIERADLVEAIARYAQPPAARRPKAMADSIAARRPEFLANRWRDLDKMRNALSNADFAAIAAIAHNCKGIGGGYGFPEISSLGAALEKAAKASDTGQLLNSLAQFEGCLSAAGQAEHPSPASGAVSPRAGEYENRAKS
jgi:CheY-like chemotaxis protein/HPt (histidine-containing phosphotransfer) domain-containing protein